MVEIRNKENPVISDIERIEIEIDRLPLDAAGIKDPKSLHEARFSVYFIAALALRDGQVTMENFIEEKVNDPELIALKEKIYATGLDNVALSSKVRVIMKNGNVYERFTPAPKGSQEKPFTTEEVKNKFKITSGLSFKQAEQVIDRIMNIEELSSARDILSLC